MGDGDEFETGPRGGLAEWTNRIAVRRAGEYRYLASFGDDHVPRTPGWDAALIRAIEAMGGTGMAYPFDGTREDIPEAVVASRTSCRPLAGSACQSYLTGIPITSGPISDAEPGASGT